MAKVKATEELKAQIAADINNGMRQRAVAKKYGVSQSMVSRLFGKPGSRGPRKKKEELSTVPPEEMPDPHPCEGDEPDTVLEA